MLAFLTLFLLLVSATPPPPRALSSSPDRFLKKSSFQSHHHDPQEYIELGHPLPFDRLTPSCTVDLLHHSFADTINRPPFTVPYSPPSPSVCSRPWSRVALDFHAECRGDQYDRVAGLWLGGAELLRTTTAEPTESGIFWRVRKDITRYSSLLVQSNLNVTMMLENVVNKIYSGVYHVKVTLFFYRENVVKVPSIVSYRSYSANNLGFNSDKVYNPPADLIMPISDDGKRGFWYRIESESDLHFKKIRFPRNAYRAILELYVSFHGDDEFWYSNPPNSYIRLNNLTTSRGNGCYREVFMTIDGKFIGSEVPFPVIFTGGINPLFWEPVVAIGAFNLPSYDIDLTPFLGLVLDGNAHEIGIGVDDGISYWLVDANLHIWLDRGSSKVEAKSVVYVNPALRVDRRENFKLLDGEFETGARRKSKFGGWVKSSSGNLTTVVSREFKFRNMIRFDNNGTYKSVRQRVKVKKAVKVRNEMGRVVTTVFVKRNYPLNVITLTLPDPKKKKDRYMLVTNVSHALKEKCLIGMFRSSGINRQVSNGWMKVKDHSVLSGEANTTQIYSLRDEYGCYYRAVAARNGRLLSDNTTLSCVSAS
ncbi:hypothetical protein JRO89_XS14G0103800 [Xanthoceras sorbifolium]|uniref:Peptide N-acetyl-beta-D-glucosaminyl asparaginase amidase A N-terminal domain-containing protein n=1 Tax=Xanthoceras sorbifolium TaxID=99658 RepID=A0ABQ8H4V2_9ROSI|nr:hypothetical protein JRO89_XS14G0103800 [Xanthoceras sorbifolium]